MTQHVIPGLLPKGDDYVKKNAKARFWQLKTVKQQYRKAKSCDRFVLYSKDADNTLEKEARSTFYEMRKRDG